MLFVFLNSAGQKKKNMKNRKKLEFLLS